MADKVYYEAAGVLLISLPVRVSLTVRTEDSSMPGKAVALFLDKNKFQHRDGDIEDVSYAVVGENGDESLDDIIHRLIEDARDRGMPIKCPVINVVDAK